MEKTVIPQSEVLDIRRSLPDPFPGMAVDFTRLAKEQEYFCKYALGMQPRAWQVRFWKSCRKNNRVLAVTGRQIGKSIAVSCYALQSAFFNTKPVGISKKTLIIMVSATEEQSKQLNENLKALILLGDENISKLTNGKVEKFFSRELDMTKRNDNSVVTFKNGCRIMSLPPTPRVRGYSPSVVFLDEAAFIETLIYNAVKPMVADTGGQIVMTTTPNGQQGYVYELFDPYDEQDEHEYDRLWFDYHCLEFDNPERVTAMMIEERLAAKLGDDKLFKQENLAEFTAQTGSFFEADFVDKCVDKEAVKLDKYDKQCDLGVDFGKQVSRTVISIVSLGTDNVMRLVYQYEYPAREDLTLMEDIEGLMKRFNIQRIIFESCPADETFRQLAVKKGLPMTEFVPQAEKLRKYTAFRQRINTGRFKMYPEQEMTKQMKGLQYEETPRTTQIFAGSGLRDDRVDSVVIAGKYILEDQARFKTFEM